MIRQAPQFVPDNYLCMMMAVYSSAAVAALKASFNSAGPLPHQRLRRSILLQEKTWGLRSEIMGRYA